MMAGADHIHQALEPRRMPAHAVAEQRVDVGFVEHDPMLDAVAEPPRHDARIVGELVGGVAIEPAAALLLKACGKSQCRGTARA